MNFIFGECELLSWVLATTNLQRPHVNPGVVDNMTVNSPITNTNFSFGLKVLCSWQNFTKVQMHCLHFLKTNDKVTIWQILTIKCLKHFSLRPCWKQWTSRISWIIIRLLQNFYPPLKWQNLLCQAVAWYSFHQQEPTVMISMCTDLHSCHIETLKWTLTIYAQNVRRKRMLNVNMYLYFISFHHNDMTQVIEIFHRGRLVPVNFYQSI